MKIKWHRTDVGRSSHDGRWSIRRRDGGYVFHVWWELFDREESVGEFDTLAEAKEWAEEELREVVT